MRVLRAALSAAMLIASLIATPARAAKDPKVIERLANFGIDPLGNTPEEFAAGLATDIRFWADAAKIAGVQPTDDK